MKVYISLFVILLFSTTRSFAQNNSPRVIAECIVQYELMMDEKADADLIKTMKGATKTIYIKGTKSRSDLVSPTYTQSIINDTKSDTTIVLTERGNTKYISYLNQQKRSEQYKRFNNITFTPTNDTKTILGYECVRVVANLKDGSTFNVYYAPSIIPSNMEYEYQFKDLPGFVFEYEIENKDGKSNNRYTATKITLAPVPTSKFEAPTSGYRIL